MNFYMYFMISRIRNTKLLILLTNYSLSRVNDRKHHKMRSILNLPRLFHYSKTLCISKTSYPLSHARAFGDYAPATRKKMSDQTEDFGLSTDEFLDRVDDLYEEIIDAVEPMIPLNKEFDIRLWPDTKKLTIYADKKAYRFTIDVKRQVLRLHSPSGALQYYFDVEENLWLGRNDKHDLRGVITRDMIRHCVGYPMFK